MNYKKNQTDNKKGKEIDKKSQDYKDNDTSNSFIKNCHIFDYKSLSFKSEEEQNDIRDRGNKRNDIFENSLVSKKKINNKKVYDNNYFKDLADKLYNSDEHLNKKKKKLRKNVSLHNVIKLNGILLSNTKRNIKTLISKKEKQKKKKRKSLFRYNKIEKKEEFVSNIKKIRESIPPKSQFGENKSKHKGSNFGSILKLKLKDKYPAKESFFESFFKNSVYSKEYTIKKNYCKSRDPSVRSIRTNKKTNNILNSEKNDTIVEEEKEIPILDKSNFSHKNTRNHTERDSNYVKKKGINKQKNKWKMVNFCCCLSSGCI